MSDVPELDAALVNDLLEVVVKTAGMTDLKAVNEVARMQLARINADLEDILRPPEPVQEESEDA